MGQFIARRLLMAMVTLVALSLALFVALRLIPGDPVVAQLGGTLGASAQAVANARAELGIDEPVLVQYVDWVTGVVRGDFGQSYFSTFPVTTLISQRIGPTLEITALSLLFGVALAVGLASFATARRSRIVSQGVDAYAAIGLGTPRFMIGIALIVVFAVRFGVLPARGYAPIEEGLWSHVQYLVLPVATMAFSASAAILRILVGSMREVEEAPFVQTAQSKGLQWPTVTLRHVLPNALLPAIAVVGLVLGSMLSGIVIVEYVFGVPGLGALAVEAAFKRDYIVLQGVVMLVAAIYVVVSTGLDILTGAIDPRLRVDRVTQ